MYFDLSLTVLLQNNIDPQSLLDIIRVTDQISLLNKILHLDNIIVQIRRIRANIRRKFVFLLLF